MSKIDWKPESFNELSTFGYGNINFGIWLCISADLIDNIHQKTLGENK